MSQSTKWMIHVRPTRVSEQFIATDKFLAWFDGDAAGTMAETPEKAVQKIIECEKKQNNDNRFVI